MKLRNKLFSVLLLLCLCFVPVTLSGCIGFGSNDTGGGGSSDDSGGGDSGGSSDGGEDDGDDASYDFDMNEYFAGVDTAYVDNTTDSEIVEKYKTLGNSIMNALSNVYGGNGSSVSISYGGKCEYNNGEIDFYDTHRFKSSPQQDFWAWGKNNGSVFTENHKNLMVQNIFETVLNLDISNSYLESSLTNYASKVDHKGLFYYEADAIAEYILKCVIGDDVVLLDNEKFIDVDNNGTFDNDYYYYTAKTYDYGERCGVYNQIKDYTNTNERAEASTKSSKWNTINFGEGDLSALGKINNKDVYTSDGVLLDYLFEGTYTNNKDHLEVEGAWKVDHPMSCYAMLKDFLNNPTNEYKYLDKGNSGNKSFIAQEEYGSISFSGFKNYVNTVYSIVYKAVEDLNWDIETKTIGDFASINNYGITTGDESFGAESNIYKAITLIAKKDVSISSLSLFFELDASVTTSVDMDVFANYVRKENGMQVSTKARLGSITINPGEYSIINNDNSVVFDMTIESDDDFSKSTEFYSLGIKEFKLTKANEPYGKYIVAPSENFIGSATNYVDFNNDFIELSFVITTEGKQNIKYKFGFMGIAVE